MLLSSRIEYPLSFVNLSGSLSFLRGSFTYKPLTVPMRISPLSICRIDQDAKYSSLLKLYPFNSFDEGVYRKQKPVSTVNQISPALSVIADRPIKGWSTSQSRIDFF